MDNLNVSTFGVELNQCAPESKQECDKQVVKPLDPIDQFAKDGLRAEQQYKRDGFDFPKSLQEEQELLYKYRKQAFEDGKRFNRDLLNGQFGNIKDNDAPIKLTGIDETSTMACGTYPASFACKADSFRNYYWPECAEEMSEQMIFLNGDHSMEECINFKKENLAKLEEKISDYVENNVGPRGSSTDELLVLSGLKTTDDPDSEEDEGPKNPNLRLLDKIKEIGDFPESIKFSFSDKFLCVNGVPTNIPEFDLCCLFSGLLLFTTEDKAINKIAKLVCRRINPIFGQRHAEEEKGPRVVCKKKKRKKMKGSD